MTNLRTTRALRDYLRSEFPAWLITDDPRPVDAITRPTVIITPADINRIRAAGKVLAVGADVTLWLLTEKLKADEVETALDSTIFPLLGALEKHPNFTWEKASRGALDKGGHGYQIPVTVIYQIEQLD